MYSLSVYPYILLICFDLLFIELLQEILFLSVSIAILECAVRQNLVTVLIILMLNIINETTEINCSFRISITIWYFEWKLCR